MENRASIMIVAGEASGDLHAANLVHALRAQFQSGSYEFFGLGGLCMADAGVRLLYDIRHLASIGLVEAIPKLCRYYACMRTLLREAQNQRPRVVILVDFPDFNLRLARRLKVLGFRIIYYISPQIWAWREKRIELVRKYVDKMMVILPFEKEFYRERGVDVSFVGHPLSSFSAPPLNIDALRREFNLVPERKVVALLPGSRVREIRYILPPLLEAAVLINREVPTTFLLAAAPDMAPELYAELIQRFQSKCPENNSIDLRVLTGCARELLSVADISLVKSGTATIDGILAEAPFIVIYKISWLSWCIGKMLVDTPHYGLVNLIAGRRVVPELLQKDASPRKMAEYAMRWLSNPGETSQIRKELRSLKERLGPGNAAQEAARIVMNYL
ncbi:MAG: lipid-A-disaccharide synthase [Acidobacteria bacterium]|nr:lipid-A-disaccharide synthase [Acidobacteriota bacterium]MBI3657756.1 lipid-A-disaccharide synthase [Acidobacteriota bacterium]